jgi:hypothetical protein
MNAKITATITEVDDEILHDLEVHEIVTAIRKYHESAADDDIEAILHIEFELIEIETLKALAAALRSAR